MRTCALNCPQCDLLIPTACARCKRPFLTVNKLRAELVQAQSEVARLNAELKRDRAAENPPTQLFPHVLPSMARWKHLLIEEAVRRSSSRNTAADLVGIGKTTIYRILKGTDATR